MKNLLCLTCLASLLLLPGCALWPWGKQAKKSSAHIYSGDAPTLKMSATDKAGGNLTTY
jgi:hypothetical protein